MEKMICRQGMADTPKAWIYYKEIGHGVPILMLHGNAETHMIFDFYEKKLSANYRVILMDSRAHGRSRIKPDNADAEFTTADMAKDAAGASGCSPDPVVYPLWFSDGANIALEFASLFPGADAFCESLSAGNITPDGLIFPVRMFCIGKYYFYRILSTLFRTCFLSQKRPRRVDSPASHPQKKWHAFADMVYSHVFRCQQLASLLCNSPLMTKEQLHAIQAPVLLLAGTRDLVKTSHSRLMARLIPRAQLVLVNGATHTSMFGRKQFYLNVILDFLKGCPAAPFGCMAAKRTFDLFKDLFCWLCVSQSFIYADIYALF